MEELQKTLKVDDIEYNINAVHSDTADKVSNKLIFKKTNLDGSTSAQNLIEFDGSEEKALEIVPAAGGGFSGRITVPDFTNQQMDKKAVLNSSDIKKFIVSELMSNSVLAEWNGDTLTLHNGGEGTSIKSISIITGDDDKKNTFAAQNNIAYTNGDDYLSAFIYISDDEGNKGNIYFGTCATASVVGVQVKANEANTAAQLASTQHFSVSLASSATNLPFNGTQDVALGVTGVLPVSKGGTGQTTVDEARIALGAAPRTHSHYYASSKEIGGKAEHAELADVATKAAADENGKNIANNYQLKILTGTVDPANSTATAVKNAPNGAIYIKY